MVEKVRELETRIMALKVRIVDYLSCNGFLIYVYIYVYICLYNSEIIYIIYYKSNRLMCITALKQINVVALIQVFIHKPPFVYVNLPSIMCIRKQ